jgi:hypothetical protein
VLIYGICVFLIDRAVGITFETNDDVATMMIAHGFGIAAMPSPILPFSNVLEGWIVQFLGWRFWAAGYGVYLMSVLVLAGGVAVRYLTRLSGEFWASFLMVGALQLRPMMQPQFTIVAGFLAIGAVLATVAYARDGRGVDLFMAAVLTVLAYLMRSQALALVALVGLPFLMRWPFFRDRRAWIAFGATSTVILSAAWFDRQQQLGPEWLPFATLNPYRAVFTDFGMADAVRSRPDVMQNVGWSANDLTLLQKFWIVDPVIADPERLRQAIAAVELENAFQLDSSQLVLAWTQLSERGLWLGWLLVLAITLMLRGKSLATAATGLLILVAITCLLTAAGRLNIGRVYYPAIAALALFSLAIAPPAGRLVRTLVAGAAVLGLLFMLTLLVPIARERAASLERMRPRIAVLSAADIHVNWNGLPFEILYPVFSRGNPFPSFRIFGIGVTSLAPYSVAHWGRDIRGFFTQFTSPEGLSIFTWPGTSAMLDIYCSEHFKGVLREEAVADLGPYRYSNVACLGGVTFPEAVSP